MFFTLCYFPSASIGVWQIVAKMRMRETLHAVGANALTPSPSSFLPPTAQSFVYSTEPQSLTSHHSRSLSGHFSSSLLCTVNYSGWLTLGFWTNPPLLPLLLHSSSQGSLETWNFIRNGIKEFKIPHYLLYICWYINKMWPLYLTHPVNISMDDSIDIYFKTPWRATQNDLVGRIQPAGLEFDTCGLDAHLAVDLLLGLAVQYVLACVPRCHFPLDVSILFP